MRKSKTGLGPARAGKLAVAEKRGPSIKEEPDDEDELFLGVEELTLDDMLPVYVEAAKKGLRRNSIDGLEELIEFVKPLSNIPRERWWPRADVRRQVVQFLRRHLKRTGDRWQLKRSPHRMRSTRQDRARFWRDPNRIAADVVRTQIAADRRHRRPGKPKQRLQRAVDEINAHPAFRDLPAEKKASIEKVRELLRRVRGKRPVSRFDDDPNGRD